MHWLHFNGKGIFVPIAFFIGIFVEILIDRYLSLSMRLTALIGTIVAAGINQFVSVFLIDNSVRYTINEETGKKYRIKDKSSFCLIPVKYWTLIILVFGIFAAFTCK